MCGRVFIIEKNPEKGVSELDLKKVSKFWDGKKEREKTGIPGRTVETDDLKKEEDNKIIENSEQRLDITHLFTHPSNYLDGLFTFTSVYTYQEMYQALRNKNQYQ